MSLGYFLLVFSRPQTFFQWARLRLSRPTRLVFKGGLLIFSIGYRQLRT